MVRQTDKHRQRYIQIQTDKQTDRGKHTEMGKSYASGNIRETKRWRDGVRKCSNNVQTDGQTKAM